MIQTYYDRISRAVSLTVETIVTRKWSCAISIMLYGSCRSDIGWRCSFGMSAIASEACWLVLTVVLLHTQNSMLVCGIGGATLYSVVCLRMH